jgi:hypothetical protein
MHFEFLANELIISIFEYFNGIQLLRSFHNLNYRLNSLLYLHFQTFPLDFQAITKYDFDYICQEKLSLIINQITSFRLSDDFDSPDQPLLLYSYGFTFQKFINLKSLFLYYICSTELLNKLIADCHYLIYLNISKSYFDDDDSADTIELCIDNIWSLPKLIYCYLDITFSNAILVPLPTKISPSIQYLSFQNDPVTFTDLADLFKSTPNLQTLSIQCKDSSDIQQFPSMFPLLTKLTISIRSSLHILTNFLQNLPNLSYLMLETFSNYINGYQWEQIIINHLLKLKIFRLMMNFRLHSGIDMDKQIDKMLESFQTKFWLKEHQWFVRCDCNTEYRTIHLYTLPNKFKLLLNYDPQISKSTCLDNKKYCSFDCVEKLEFNSYFNKYGSDFSMQYPNIHHLQLCFPFHDILWSLLPSFDRLKSVELLPVTYDEEEKDHYFNQLKLFFERAIHLYSLITDEYLMLEFSLFKITNKFIRRLDLQASNGHFYGSECISLIHSLLNNQCEVIFINLEKRTIIIELINSMPNLRAMNIQCRDDTWNEDDQLTQKDDELVHWLQQHLPSTCSIVRDNGYSPTLRLWIR